MQSIRRYLNAISPDVKSTLDLWSSYIPKKPISVYDIEVLSIGTGSSGNCYYVKNKSLNRNVVFDLGISPKLTLLHVNFAKVDNIFISHFHNDHDIALPAISKIYNTSKIITPLVNNDNVNKHKVSHVDSDWTESVNYAYVDSEVLYLTDWGSYDKSLVDWIVDNIEKNNIKVALIESNHCWHYMVENISSYQPAHAQRSMSDVGHANFEQTYNLLKEVNEECISRGLPIIWDKNNGNIPLLTVHIASNNENMLKYDCPFNIDKHIEVGKWYKY